VVMWTASASPAALPVASGRVLPHPIMQIIAVKASMLENRLAVDKKQILLVMTSRGPIAFSADTITHSLKRNALRLECGALGGYCS
jgi:hypothetical protein